MANWLSAIAHQGAGQQGGGSVDYSGMWNQQAQNPNQGSYDNAYNAFRQGLNQTDKDYMDRQLASGSGAGYEEQLRNMGFTPNQGEAELYARTQASSGYRGVGVPPAPGGCTAGAAAQASANNALYQQQIDMLNEQLLNTRSMTELKANEAAAENLREVELEQAKADAAKEERLRRSKKGKRDLLWDTGMGTLDEDEDEQFLLLGDN